MTRIFFKKQARTLGLKRYFTGVPCCRGHIADRYVSTGMCSECSKLYTKNWRLNHLEFYAEKQRRYKAGLTEEKRREEMEKARKKASDKYWAAPEFYRAKRREDGRRDRALLKAAKLLIGGER